MSYCDTRVPNPVVAINFLSQKLFQLFFKTGFFIFQDNEISFSEKIFPTFESESRYRNEIPKAETTLYM